MRNSQVRLIPTSPGFTAARTMPTITSLPTAPIVPRRFRRDSVSMARKQKSGILTAAQIELASYSIENGRTTVPLHLEQRESVFVVFRKPASAPSRVLPAVTSTTLTSVDGPWRITFQPNLGAPEGIEMAKLKSWSLNADDGVKYFSGTATYAQTIQAPQSWISQGSKIMLDLGGVGDVAEVSINGTKVGTLWKPPYKIDVTGPLRAGANELQISVTNEWSNRIAGDAAAVARGGKRVLSGGGGRGGFTGARGGGGNLAPSGLLGPVTLISETVK